MTTAAARATQQMYGGAYARPAPQVIEETAPIATTAADEKVLPLPGWLVKVYFIFPVILYIPDVIFNYYVYSDGATTTDPNPLVQASYVALWGFLSVGVVGMAYLLSVLGPWHWSQGHRIQAFFCAMGVLIATGITTWNSLSYRSVKFHAFNTDSWAYAIWPNLANSNISLTMILVAIAPPFWGLFWAVVQPTQSRRSLKHLQESHNERLVRLQQEAEVKRMRAETNATIREAQLRGMAKTAGAAREQMTAALGRTKSPTPPSLGVAVVEERPVKPVPTGTKPRSSTRMLPPRADSAADVVADTSPTSATRATFAPGARGGLEHVIAPGAEFAAQAPVRAPR